MYGRSVRRVQAAREANGVRRESTDDHRPCSSSLVWRVLEDPIAVVHIAAARLRTAGYALYILYYIYGNVPARLPHMVYNNIYKVP